MPTRTGERVRKTGTYICENCGKRILVREGEDFPRCSICGNNSYCANPSGTVLKC